MSDTKLYCWSHLVRDFCPCFSNRPRFYKAKAPLAKSCGQASHEQMSQDQEQIRRDIETTRIKTLSNRIKEIECQESAKLIQHLSSTVSQLEETVVGLESKINSLTTYLHDFEEVSNQNIDIDIPEQPSKLETSEKGMMDFETSVVSKSNTESSHLSNKELEQESSLSTSSLQKIEVNSNGDIISES